MVARGMTDVDVGSGALLGRFSLAMQVNDRDDLVRAVFVLDQILRIGR